MESIGVFWAAHGDEVIVGIAIVLGAGALGWLLLKAWRILLAVVGAVLRFVFWALIGSWARPLWRKYVTG
jgi:Na+-transporting NADH:ubiquinone oxidoreductase subunit NqrB